MPSMPPGTAAVRAGVRTLLRNRVAVGALAAGDLVLVACSGGADSLALAAATAFVAPRLGLRAGAVSVDHGMQPGSERVARAAIAQCADLGLDPALVLRGEQPAPPGQGPEAGARAVRYRALEQGAEATGAAAVLLGHTLDDQAETVLLALARGSGTRTVAGMAPVRSRYLRPLLGIRRSETEAACAEAGLQVWEDPTNLAGGPWRTAAGSALPRAGVRERVLPLLAEVLGPGVIESLGRTAQLARADADALDDLAAAAYERIRRPAGKGAQQESATRTGDDRGASPVVVLSVAELEQQPTAVRTRVLHRAALEAGSRPGALAATHVFAVEALVTAHHGQGPIHLPSGVRVVRRYGNLEFDQVGTDCSGEARGRQNDG